MVGSMTACMVVFGQTWCWSLAENSTPGSSGNRKREPLDLAWASETPKPIPSDKLPSIRPERPHLLLPITQIWVSGDHSYWKTPHPGLCTSWNSRLCASRKQTRITFRRVLEFANLEFNAFFLLHCILVEMLEGPLKSIQEAGSDMHRGFCKGHGSYTSSPSSPREN